MENLQEPTVGYIRIKSVKRADGSNEFTLPPGTTEKQLLGSYFEFTLPKKK